VVLFSCFRGFTLYFFIVCSLIIGAFGAIKQSRLRGILAYSSIAHIGWVITGVTVRVSIGVIYLFTYCAITFLIMIKLSKVNRFSALRKDLSVVFVLFSMRGLPPLIGFFPKI